MAARLTLFIAVVSIMLGARVPAQGGIHKDEQRGYQIRPPADWTPIPIGNDQKWVIAKYLSDREYVDRKEGYSHRPDMRVVLFPHAVTKERGAKVTSRGNRLVVDFKNPYRDFDAYLKANARGGFYLLSTKDRKVDGVEVTCKRYKFEKLTTQRIGIAWIFHGRDADWAVYFEALEDEIDKLEPVYRRSLKSFRFIQRKGSIVEGGTTGTGEVEIELDGDGKKKEKTPAEILKEREAAFDRHVRQASAKLTKGWKVQKSRNFVAFTHVDKKYTTKLLKHCEAVRKWMDRYFAFLKDGKPGRMVIRICKDQPEERAFAETSGTGFWGIEIITHKPVGEADWEMDFVNRAIVSRWFRDKNKNLAWGMPGWLDAGLDSAIGSAELKGGRLVMRPSIWEKTNMRELARADNIAKPRAFLSASWQEFARVEHASSQAGTFVRFLLTGPKRQVKGFMETYMKAILEVAAEEEARDEAEKEKRKKEGRKELTEEEQEEEEERRFRERKGREKKRVDAIFKKAFGSWSESKWKKFESSYLQFAG